MCVTIIVQQPLIHFISLIYYFIYNFYIISCFLLYQLSQNLFDCFWLKITTLFDFVSINLKSYLIWHSAIKQMTEFYYTHALSHYLVVLVDLKATSQVGSSWETMKNRFQ